MSWRWSEFFRRRHYISHQMPPCLEESWGEAAKNSEWFIAITSMSHCWGATMSVKCDAKLKPLQILYVNPTLRFAVCSTQYKGVKSRSLPLISLSLTPLSPPIGGNNNIKCTIKHWLCNKNLSQFRSNQKTQKIILRTTVILQRQKPRHKAHNWYVSSREKQSYYWFSMYFFIAIGRSLSSGLIKSGIS